MKLVGNNPERNVHIYYSAVAVYRALKCFSELNVY